MANNWGIPKWLENLVKDRDQVCVYCGVEFTTSQVCRRTAASWEHIVNDASIVTPENIALCCCGCNSSKGAKPLLEWLESKYCKARGINSESVSSVVQSAIKKSLGSN
jgi:hypothetical protein